MHEFEVFISFYNMPVVDKGSIIWILYAHSDKCSIVLLIKSAPYLQPEFFEINAKKASVFFPVDTLFIRCIR